MGVGSDKLVYTIGHGNRRVQQVILLLEQYSINRIIDVRATPFSQYAPGWNRNVLRELLPQLHFEYIYMGNLLGEKSSKRELYTDGVIDYEKLAETESFRNAIRRLMQYADGRTSLLCTETNPLGCHRSLLIGRSLKAQRIETHHIVGRENPYIRTQSDLEEEMIEEFYPDRWQLSMFSEPLSNKQMLENSYRLMNRRTGWVWNLDLEFASKTKQHPI